MKKKSTLVFLAGLALCSAVVFSPLGTEALAQRGYERAGRAVCLELGNVGKVSSKVHARKRLALQGETTTNTTGPKTGDVKAEYGQNRGSGQRANCTQDPELCVPALDGTGRHQHGNALK